METWDFIFYEDTIKAQMPVIGQVHLSPAKRQNTSEQARPPKASSSTKAGTKGLIGVSPWRARPRTSLSRYIKGKDGIEKGGAPRGRTPDRDDARGTASGKGGE
jgi:hypothetical protein